MEFNGDRYEYYYESPIGFVRIITTGNYLAGMDFVDNVDIIEKQDAALLPEIMEKTVSELDLYFKGELKDFTINFMQKTTPFRQKVYSELVKIPYGETISYKELAERIGNPKAIRAVGGANHHNNIWIVVPCHRVIGSDGSLTGYGGGISRKEYLLQLEKRFI